MRKIGRFYTVYRSNGKRGFIRRRRTYRTRIGVGSQPVVAVLFRIHRGVIRIGCGSDQRNARRTHFIIYVRHFFLVYFARKAAARAERHVDHVHAQSHAVFESRKQPRSFCAGLRIGKHFHNRKLRIRRNARDRFVFSRDHAGNVRAVLRADRRNVRVFIRIIVSIRHFAADVHVLGGKSRRIFRRRRASDLRSDRRKGKRLFGSSKIIHGKCRVRIVKTGIEYGNHNAVALIFRFGAIENTGIVNVYVVGNHLRFRRRVYVADNQRCVGRKNFIRFFEIFRFDRNFKAAQNGIVFFAKLIFQAGFIQLFNQLISFAFGGASRSASFARGNVLFHRALIIGSFVSVQHGISLHRNNHGNFL